MRKCYWRIRGYDGPTRILDRTVGIGQFSDDQIKHLLKTLAAKAGLDYDEIVGAYAKRRTKIANDRLAVHRDSEFSTYTCGSDPHFAATVVDEKGKPIRHPKLA